LSWLILVDWSALSTKTLAYAQYIIIIIVLSISIAYIDNLRRVLG